MIGSYLILVNAYLMGVRCIGLQRSKMLLSLMGSKGSRIILRLRTSS